MKDHTPDDETRSRWRIVRSIDRRELLVVVVAVMCFFAMPAGAASASGGLAVASQHDTQAEFNDAQKLTNLTTTSQGNGAVELISKTAFSDGFEDEPADSGVPEDWESVDGSGFSVNDSLAYNGDQSAAIDYESGLADMRPNTQPYSSAKTAPVSVWVRNTKTTTDQAGVALYESGTRITYVAIRNDDLKYFDGSSWVTIATAPDANEWVQVEINSIDTSSDTFSVDWQVNSGESGTATGLSFETDVVDGYTETELRQFGTDALYDNFRVGDGPPDSATYLSPVHEVTGGEQAAVNITALRDTTVNATVLHNGTTLNQTSITSTGNHTLALDEYTGNEVELELSVEVNGLDPEFTLADESILFNSNTPTLDNSSASPSGGTTVSETPVELSINVSDADFGTSQGDEVKVTFYDASNESKIASDTLTENGTATASWEDVVGGENEWYAVATDSYGNSVTSQTFTFKAPATLEIRDLDTRELITEDSDGNAVNVEVQFFGQDTVETRNTTDGAIDLSGLPVDERFAVSVDAGDGYYQRQIIIPSLIEQETAYLLNASDSSVTVVQPRFVLEDPSNQFDTEESEIVFERPLEINGSTKYVPVAGDRIGLNGYDAILEEGQRYRVTVRDPTSGSERRLGEYTATTSGPVTLAVQDVEFDSVSDVDGLEWGAEYITNEDDTNEVRFVYRDSLDTESVEYEIVERGNESKVLASGTATGNVTVTETVPPSESDTVWRVSFNATRADGETLSGSRVVSSSKLPVGDFLPTEWQTAFSVVTLFVVAGLFGGVKPGVGGIAVASTGGFFFLINWLPGRTTGLMVLLAFFIAVLSYAARQARGATA